MIKNYFNWNIDVDRMVIFTSEAPANLVGKKLPISSPIHPFPVFEIKYSYKVNLETLDVMDDDDCRYDICTWPTLNDLKQYGLIEDWAPFKNLIIYDAHKIRKPNGRLDMDAIIKRCADEGLKVSKKALSYCYSAWSHSLKSGYRDEKNGTHVFAPCGGNPFDLQVSELHPTASDWQTTYTR